MEAAASAGKSIQGWTSYRWEGEGQAVQDSESKFAGNFAARIEGAGPGKIGLFQSAALEPCRYRLIAMVAGADLVPGRWQLSARLVVALGDATSLQYPVITGDSDWRTMTLVFSVPVKQKVTIYFFNYGSGAFFVDDVRLTADTQCNPEAAIFSVGEVTKALNYHPPISDEDRLLAGYCPRPDFADRPVCKQLKEAPPNPPALARAMHPLIIADFETRMPFEAPSVVPLRTAWSIDRSAVSLKPIARLPSGGSMVGTVANGLPPDWSDYNWLDLDVVNDSGRIVKVNIEIRDDQTKDYWSRVNWETAVQPGTSTLHIPLQVFVGEKSVIKERRRLDLAHITRLVASNTATGGDLIINQIRLVADLPMLNDFPELIKLDAGPLTGPVMSGFTPLLPTTRYRPLRGYGFSADAQIGRVEDRRHPDDLFRDWISLTKGGIDVDLPNGTYHVWMMVEDPGYWEYFPNFKRRIVTAQGRVVLDEQQTAGQFFAKYFSHANDEDIPGDDIWQRYISSRYIPLQFDAVVDDGQLNLRFDSDSNPFSLALSALIIYPVAQKVRGEAFIGELWQRIKQNFDREYKQILPPKASYPKPASNVLDGRLLVFQRPIDNDVQVTDWPAAGELTSKLSLSLARGERGVLPLGLFAESDLLLTGASLDLPGLEVTPLIVRTKLSRANQDGSTYWNIPRLLDPLYVSPSHPLVLRAQHARSFWFDIGAPSGAAAGTIEGILRLQFSDGARHEVSVSVIIHDWVLPEADVPIGYLGLAPSYPRTDFTEVEHRQVSEMGQAIRILKSNGMTAVTGGLGGPVLTVGPQGGRLLDFAQFDQTMTAILDVLRPDEINTYGGLEISGLPLDPLADTQDQFKQAYSSILGGVLKDINSHNKQRGWPSLIHSIGDEPSGADIDRVAVLGQLFRRAGSLARSAVFTSILDPARDPTAKLAGPIDRLYLTLHSEAGVRHVLAQGSECALYNQNGRFRRGIYLMKLKRAGCRGHLQFALSSVHADPWYDLDGREADISALSTHPDGQLRMALDLLRYREAVNDYRCLLKVERQIEVAPASQPAKFAQKWLSLLLQGMSLGSAGNENWTNEALNEVRQACRQHILDMLSVGKQQ